jgi:membrane protease YdiL (CAAX protease family)
VLWWVATALVILYLLRVERRQLSSIGLSPPSLQDLVLAILAAILMIAGAVVIRDGIFPVIHAQVKTTEIMRYFASPYWYRLIVVSRAACAEETLLRAFPFERLAEMTGKPVFAAVVTWAAFTASHLRTWGWAVSHIERVPRNCANPLVFAAAQSTLERYCPLVSRCCVPADLLMQNLPPLTEETLRGSLRASV